MSVGRRTWTGVLAMATCLGGGCATYQYELVGYGLAAPAGAAGPVPRGQQRTFMIGPLRYAVAVDEDRLSIEVYNPTDQTIRLLGSRSAVVDPAGRSHPLIDQTMAARSHVTVVLPPLRPWGGGPAVAYPVGEPTIGEPADDEPSYDRASPVYWDWPGPGPVRVHLVYARSDGGRFEQDLAFERSAVR